ncbi:MAG: FAD:protein FMN transferase [Clostridiales bacterium]|nr:FAD:protein FMN transferase [Clostridiales bacterium]HOA84975.1 FAD:protein FMN transferase [Bacillota bacterium]
MKRVVALFAVFIVLLTFPSCGRQKYLSHTIWCMDTLVTVKIDNNTPDAGRIFSDCEAILKSLDGKMSRTDHGSDVSRVNAYVDSAEVSDDTAAVIRTALEVSKVVGGYFDITVYPYVKMWESCGAEDKLPDPDFVRSLGSAVGYEKITLQGNIVQKSDKQTQIDLGGIGKGYAADKLVEYLISSGVEYGLVSFGSNVAVFGKKPDGSEYKVSIKDPKNTGEVVGYILMSSGVLSVTGDYERFVVIGGEKYHHVINPFDGYPANTGLHSVAVICDTGAVADALSTALFVMGKEAALEFYESGKIKFEALFIGDDGISCTPGLDTKFEPAKN